MAAFALILLLYSSGALAESQFCHFNKDASERWWLACPAAGMPKGLTIGVNHVENCDRSLLPGNAECIPGSFGPVRTSSSFEAPFCPWFCNSFDSGLNSSAYGASTQERWGSSLAWSNVTAQRLSAWGFNTIGCWSSPLFTDPKAEKQHLFGYALDMLVTPYEHRFLPTEGMPVDIWSRAFTQHCDSIASRECSPRKNDPKLLGYWIDNENKWNEAVHPADDLLSSAILTLSRDNSSSLNNVTSWLAARYKGSVEHLNLAWGTHIRSFGSAMAATMPWPKSSTRDADNIAFAEHYADVYAAVAVAAIQKYDPNHLVLGSRYNDITNPVVQAIMRGEAKHVDVLDLHDYSPQPDLRLFAELHNMTQNPVIVSEFGFRASDSGLPNTKGAGQLFQTQTQRANAFYRYLHELVRAPYVVGYHMFMLFGADSNFGLVHLSDDPYEVLTDAFTSINQQAPIWHNAQPTPNPTPPPGQKCQAIKGFACNQGRYCFGSKKPTNFSYAGDDTISACADHCRRQNCSCFMHTSNPQPPVHPACHVFDGQVMGLGASEFGYSAWLADTAPVPPGPGEGQF